MEEDVLLLVQGKPIECSLKQTLLDKLLSFSFFRRHCWKVEEESIMGSVGDISKQSSLPSKTQCGSPLEENAFLIDV